MELSNNEIKILKFLKRTPQGRNSGVDASYLLGHFEIGIQALLVILEPLVKEGLVTVTNKDRYVLTATGTNYLDRLRSAYQRKLKERIIWSVFAPVIVAVAVSLITNALIK